MKPLLPKGSKGKLHALVLNDAIKTDDGPKFVRRYASGEFKTTDGTRYKVANGTLLRGTVKPTSKRVRAKLRRAKA